MARAHDVLPPHVAPMPQRRHVVKTCAMASGRDIGRLDPAVILQLQRDAGNTSVTAAIASQRQLATTGHHQKRDAILTDLAVEPMYALMRWRRLSPKERAAVVGYMTSYYGPQFTEQFRANANSRSRRKPYREITNVRRPFEDSPKALQARGWQHLVTNDDLTSFYDIWIDPYGGELRFIRNLTKPAATVVVDPIVEEATRWAKAEVQGRDRVIRMLEDLKAARGTAEYPRLHKKYFDAFNEWQNRLNDALARAEEWSDQADASHLDQVQEQVDALNELFRWKREEWPDTVRDLPGPSSSP